MQKRKNERGVIYREEVIGEHRRNGALYSRVGVLRRGGVDGGVAICLVASRDMLL